MAGPGGREVGRVSVRVVPDSSRFSRELMQDLREIEARALVNIRTNLDTDNLARETRQAVAAAEKGARVKVKTDVDASNLPAEVDSAVRKVRVPRVPVAPKVVDTFGASVRKDVNAAVKAIEANIPLTADGERFRTEIRSQVEAVESLLKVSVPLDPEDAALFRIKVREQVAAIQARVPDIEIPVKLDDRRALDSATQLGRNINGLVGAAILLGPALVPVAAGLAAVFLAVAGPLTAATAGLGAFAILAIPTITRVVDASKALEDAQKKVTEATTDKQRVTALAELAKVTESIAPATMTAVTALNGVKQAFRDLQSLLEADIMAVFNAGLAVATAALPAIGALAKAASPALVQVADSLAAAFNRTGVEGFVGFLTSKAASAILGFAYGLANIAKGFASIIVAFDPVSRSIGGGLDSLLIKFSAIGESAGFRQFVGYVQSVGPLVASSLGAIINAFGRLLIALAPIGAVALVGLQGIANAILAIPIPVLTALLAAIVGIVAVMVTANAVLAIVAGVQAVITAATLAWAAATFILNGALAILFSPITAVILIIGVLVGGFILAYRESETFRSVIDGAMKGVGAAFKFFWDIAKQVFAWIKGNWPLLLAILTGPIGIAVGLIIGHWDTIKAVTVTAFNLVKSTVVTALAEVVTTVLSLPGQSAAALSSLGSAISSVASAAWRAFLAAVAAGIGLVLSATRGVPGQVVSALGDMGSLLYNSGRSIISGLVNGIKSMAGAVKAAVGNVLSAARNLLPFSPAKEGPFSGRGWTTYSGAAIVDGLITGIESRSSAAVSATGSLAAGMSGALDVEGSSSTGSSSRPASLDDLRDDLARFMAMVERQPREQQTLRRRR